MAEKAAEWREETVKAEGTNLIVVRGGAGKPLLILHDELGYPGWLKWNSELAKSRALLIPMHPGFGRTERAEWTMSIRDMAGFYAKYLKDQGLAPVDVMGFSLGAWIAAEMAANNPAQFGKMVLVAPAGIRPPEGEILDVFRIMAIDQLLATVKDPANTPEFGILFGGQTPEAFEMWEDARAQTARLAWQPYMFNPSLPHLLAVATDLPTLIIHGRDDKVVPVSASEAYRKAISGASMKIYNNCGHRPEIEQSAQFVSDVRSFLS